jgi:SulP family sulfate permease
VSTTTVGHKRFGLPDWLTSYEKEWLRPDIVAGLTTAAVVIPKAMAYATIAGLPVQVGLYTAFVPMAIYAMLGSSRVLSVSTTTTIAILTASELHEVVPNADPTSVLIATATLVGLVGGMLVLARILRLGFIADFISEPVLIGFKAGIGLVIVMDQVPKILGTHFTKTGFLRNFIEIVRTMPETKIVTLMVGISMIGLLIGTEKLAHKAPAPLIAVAIGIAGAYFLQLQSRGVELVGHIPQSLPSLTMPSIELSLKLWPGALGIAVMSFTETVAAGRAFAKNGEPSPNANRELLATGLANFGSAFFGAMPGGGGTSQTAVNRMAGARTQLSELVTAGMTLVTMLVLAPVIAILPQATLAAVVIVYSMGLIKPAEFREILVVRRTEFTWAVVAFAGVVFVGTLRGIIVAIVVSMITLVYQVTDPPVHVLGRKRGTNVFRPRTKEHPEDETFAGLLLLRPEGRMFFANAASMAQKIRRLIEQTRPRIVAIDMSGVLDIEYTALKMLIESEKRNRENGIRLWLVGMNPHVLQIVRKSPLGQVLGRDALFFNIEMAAEAYSGIGSFGRERRVNIAQHGVAPPQRNFQRKLKILAVSLILTALFLVPVPLLPPLRLADAVASSLGLGWKAGYLIAALGLQSVFYFTIGVLSALIVTRAPTFAGRLLQIVGAPLVVVAVAVLIRSAKTGHFPVWINAVIPIFACLFGVTLGLGSLYRHFGAASFFATAALVTCLWGLFGGTSPSFRSVVEAHLQNMIAAGPRLPSGDARFGALLQAAFDPAADEAPSQSAVRHSRTAILAWGVVVGDPRLSRLIGIDPNSDVVRRASALYGTTTLRGRTDWPRHFALSAALAVLEHPLISDAGGLMKEQMDALTHGSGFSFGDLAADRAGVRFAVAATASETGARSMQLRIQQSYVVDDFFPVVQLPENLTVEEFRREFNSVGSLPYREQIVEIEKELDACAALRF